MISRAPPLRPAGALVNRGVPMNRLRRYRPTPAMVVACIALAVAMAGTGYAATALPRNSVGTLQMKKDAITATKVKKNAITSAKVKNGSLLRAGWSPGPGSEVGARPSGWDGRRSVRRRHPDREARCRCVHPRLRQLARRETDHRLVIEHGRHKGPRDRKRGALWRNTGGWYVPGVERHKPCTRDHPRQGRRPSRRPPVLHRRNRLERSSESRKACWGLE